MEYWRHKMATYTLIESQVLGSTTASVTFSAIPATYTDLVVRASVRSDRANTQDDVRITFNSTTTNYSYTYLRGSASAATSSNAADPYAWFGNIPAATATSNTFGNGELYIPSYTASQNKPSSAIMAMENNVTSPVYLTGVANLWSNSAAISTIYLYLGFGSFVSGSSFYLYGIKNS
jgi:hypothetical protein